MLGEDQLIAPGTHLLEPGMVADDALHTVYQVVKVVGPEDIPIFAGRM